MRDGPASSPLRAVAPSVMVAPMTDTATIPGDASASFLLDGYLFGHRRFERLGTDVFRTRLMGRPITLLRGQEAARFFGEEERFDRRGAMPKSVLHSLQDEGSVQTLSGAAHHDRKAAFLSALDPAGEASLAKCFLSEWDAAWEEWGWRGGAALLPAVEQVLADSALIWLGLVEPKERRRDLARRSSAMIDGAGSFGPRNWWGRAARRPAERWAREAVRAARRGERPLTGPLARLLRAPGLEDDAIAAVELLNLLRPTIAIARFTAFAALALHLHPEWRSRLRDDPSEARLFAQEVRRTTPFFPMIAGRATRNSEWRGVPFAPGDWAALDLFATNRHPREWAHADRFDPERFRDEPEERVVAQGSGPMASGHRCPGEPATVDLLTLSVERLAAAEWTVPAQDLRVNLSRLPALPGRAGMLIRLSGRESETP